MELGLVWQSLLWLSKTREMQLKCRSKPICKIWYLRFIFGDFRMLNEWDNNKLNIKSREFSRFRS